eukprot:scaffold34247_cov42-Attheya_sp.AAC.1
MLFSTATAPNSIATLTKASSMVGASASWRIEGSGDVVSVVGEFDMVAERKGGIGRSALALKGSTEVELSPMVDIISRAYYRAYMRTWDNSTSACLAAGWLRWLLN